MDLTVHHKVSEKSRKLAAKRGQVLSTESTTTFPEVEKRMQWEKLVESGVVRFTNEGEPIDLQLNGLYGSLEKVEIALKRVNACDLDTGEITSETGFGNDGRGISVSSAYFGESVPLIWVTVCSGYSSVESNGPELNWDRLLDAVRGVVFSPPILTPEEIDHNRLVALRVCAKVKAFNAEKAAVAEKDANAEIATKKAEASFAAELEAWASSDGSELLQARIENSFEWQGLAYHEWVECYLKRTGLLKHALSRVEEDYYSSFEERTRPTLREIRFLQVVEEELSSSGATSEIVWGVPAMDEYGEELAVEESLLAVRVVKPGFAKTRYLRIEE